MKNDEPPLASLEAEPRAASHHNHRTPIDFQSIEIGWLIAVILLFKGVICYFFLQGRTTAGSVVGGVAISYFGCYCYFLNKMGPNDVGAILFGQRVVRLVTKKNGYPFVLRPFFSLETFGFREIQVVIGKETAHLRGPQQWGYDTGNTGIRFSPAEGKSTDGIFLYPQVTLILTFVDYGALLRNEGDLHAASTQLGAEVYRFLEELSTGTDAMEFDNQLATYTVMLASRLIPVIEHMGFSGNKLRVQMTAGLPVTMIAGMQKRAELRIDVDSAALRRDAVILEAKGRKALVEAETADEVLKLASAATTLQGMITRLKSSMPEADDGAILELAGSLARSVAWNTATVPEAVFAGLPYGPGERSSNRKRNGKPS